MARRVLQLTHGSDLSSEGSFKRVPERVPLCSFKFGSLSCFACRISLELVDAKFFDILSELNADAFPVQLDQELNRASGVEFDNLFAFKELHAFRGAWGSKSR